MNFHQLALITTLIAFIAIMLGAYTRLSNAGLGCPDWPGCYGQLNVPVTADELSQANEAFPDKPLETDKAWKEMTHRYVAGTLGLLILIMCLVAWKNKKNAQQAIILPTILVGIVIFQALLGMWTVTLLLKPLVVVVHLLFGFTTLAILFWLTLKSGHYFRLSEQLLNQRYRLPALLAVIILVMQIALGGWTSSNYAALVCPDLPTCQASWWPDMNFNDAFVLWPEEEGPEDEISENQALITAVNYEGGVLDLQARTAIHWTHRMGAVITFLYLFSLGITIYRKSQGNIMPMAGLLITGIVVFQFCLGLANVFFNLPLFVAVAHNATAALLLLSLVLLNYILHIRD